MYKLLDFDNCGLQVSFRSNSKLCTDTSQTVFQDSHHSRILRRESLKLHILSLFMKMQLGKKGRKWSEGQHFPLLSRHSTPVSPQRSIHFALLRQRNSTCELFDTSKNCTFSASTGPDCRKRTGFIFLSPIKIRKLTFFHFSCDKFL